MGMVENILLSAVSKGYSDVFLTAGKPPAFRRSGAVASDKKSAVLSSLEIDSFRSRILSMADSSVYDKKGGFDTSWTAPDGQRFRLNFLATVSGPMIAARPVGQGDNLFFDKLNLPETLKTLCENERGLVLVAGATGSGKSTTLGAMINHINRKFAKHILTIEDPVEYLFSDLQSVVTQRELNGNVSSFGEALRSAMRENPDVIVIGEMRDEETIYSAINAALTGHLVIGTVHSGTTVQAVERIINLFPENRREQVALDLGSTVTGVVAQRLLPDVNGNMLPAIELLRGTPVMLKELSERNFAKMEYILRENAASGMLTFNRSVYNLYRQQKITLDSALGAVDNPAEFMLLVQGMESGVDAFRSFYSGDSDGNPDTVDMHQLLRTAVKTGASDLILSAGAVPQLRISGTLQPLELPPLQTPDTKRLFYSILNQRQQADFESRRELDMSLAVNFVLDRKSGEVVTSRFRINGFFQRGSIGVVARVIPRTIPSPEVLNLPHQLLKLSDTPQGLILVVGPTGSGKSTTMAAFIDLINRTRPAHIVSVEDPIEYVHDCGMSVIEQRELHSDTLSFSAGLKYALRQDPDVIMVGEMRDLETISAVLSAAETGHLVLATLHTNSAIQTIDRIVDSFPAGQQNQIRQQLAGVLLSVVSQRLVPRKDGKGRVGAFEIMMGTAPIRALIREGKTHMLQSSMETGYQHGMVTMARALEDLLVKEIITEEEAEKVQSGI